MKYFDYECERCGIVEEHLVKDADVKICCVECGKRMERLPPLVNFCNSGKAMTYFRKPDGTLVIPPSTTTPTPKGWQREEAKGMYERNKIRDEVQTVHQEKARIRNIADDIVYEERRKQHFDEVKAHMGDFDTHTQQFMKAQMEHINKKGRRKKKTLPEFELGTNFSNNEK